jgi:hypothetical protein
MVENQRFKNHLCPHHRGHDYSKICPQTDFGGSRFPDDKDIGGPRSIGLLAIQPPETAASPRIFY